MSWLICFRSRCKAHFKFDCKMFYFLGKWKWRKNFCTFCHRKWQPWQVLKVQNNSQDSFECFTIIKHVYNTLPFKHPWSPDPIYMIYTYILVQNCQGWKHDWCLPLTWYRYRTVYPKTWNEYVWCLYAILFEAFRNSEWKTRDEKWSEGKLLLDYYTNIVHTNKHRFMVGLWKTFCSNFKFIIIIIGNDFNTRWFLHVFYKL